MDGFQQCCVGMPAFPFYVANLAADHAAHRAGCCGEFRDQGHLAVSAEIAGRLHLRQYLKRQREQRVARQNGDSVAEYFVAGRHAATQIVVIERRQIVMDQGIGMNQFESAGARFDAGRRIRYGLRGGHAQNGANAFATREQAVSHGFVDGFGYGLNGWNPTLQCFVDARLLPRDVFGQRHALSCLKGSGRKGSAWILSPLRISISMRVSASSNCLRQVSLNCIPFSNNSRARSSGSSPLSISLTISSSCWSPVSKLAADFSSAGIVIY